MWQIEPAASRRLHRGARWSIAFILPAIRPRYALRACIIDRKQEDSFVRKLFLLAVAAVAIPWSTFAQESTPKAEAFGGYSYFRASDPATINLHGWNGSITGNLNDWFGVVGDFSGHYGSPSIFGFGIPLVDVNQHSFLFGPRISYRGNDTVTPFGHFLVGVSRASAGLSASGVPSMCPCLIPHLPPPWVGGSISN